MDDFKHPHTETAGHIDTSSVRECLKKGDARLALQYCHELLACNPKHIQTLLFAVLASRSLGWLEEALGFINRASVIAPNHPVFQSLMGDILLLKNRPKEALSALLQAQEFGDSSAQTCFNIGSAYLALAAYEDAKIYFDKALAIDPQMAVAHVNKGLAEHSLMNLDAALRCFDEALCIDPSNIDAKWNKSHVLLTIGRYEEGFKLYETRWQHSQVRLKKQNFDSKFWLGKENLSGKTILLFAEGGFGDTLQFIRYAKLFNGDVNLIIQCQLPLIDLIKGMGIRAEIITLGEIPPAHDYHCPLMSLPLAFGTTVETVPQCDQYVFADPNQAQFWVDELQSLARPKIGVMVRGSGSFKNDRRAIELAELAKFLPPSWSYVFLQKDLEENELRYIRARSNWRAPCPTFSGAAAICHSLDHIITVDTSIAHLSAAMGKPTTVLLAYRPDWRWGAEGETTEWYPSARLIRQNHLGSWKDALSTWHMDCLQDFT